MFRRIWIPLTCVALAVAAFIGFATVIGTSTDRAQLDARRVYETIRDEVSLAVQEAEQTLIRLAAEQDAYSMDEDVCSHVLARYLEENRRVHDVFLRIDFNGDLECTPAGSVEGVNFKERVYFQKAIDQRGFVIGEFLIGKVSGEPVLAVALPVNGNGKEVQKVFVAGLKVGWLKEVLSTAQIGTSLVVELQDANETLLSYFTGETTASGGVDRLVELIRLPLFPEGSDTVVVIFQQT